MPRRPGEDLGRGRLRRRPARVRRGRRAEALEARGRPSPRRPAFGPHRHLVEFRGESPLTVGETVTVESFEPGDAIKVSGVTVGKGFQGTIKRHNFSRGPVSHGSHNVRKPGSIGASAYPSRVFKGKKMPGRMGGTRVTQPGLVVHEVDVERNLLLIRGSVPGSKSGILEIVSA